MRPVASPLLDQFTPWSISKSDLAAKCGKAFHLRYVDKLPRTTSEASRVGTAAHRVQELLLVGHAPKEALQKGLAEAIDLTSKEVEPVEALLGNMVDFVARLSRFKEKHNVVEEFYEQQWAVNRKFELVKDDDPDVFVRGVVDYAARTASNHIIVIDHKSGRRHPVEKYAKQLDLYAIFALAAFPDIGGVHAALHYIATKDIDWHHPRSARDVRKVLQPHLVEYLRQRADNLKGFEPRVNKLCGWCDYIEHCPEGTAFVAEQKEMKRVETNRRAREKRAEKKAVKDARNSKKRTLVVVYGDESAAEDDDD